MFDNIKLSEVMSPVPVTINPNDTMDKVEDLFDTQKFRHLPVVDEAGKVVGIISKSDYLTLCDSRTVFFKELDKERNRRFLSSILVEEVMVKPVARLRYDARISNALGMFRENMFHAIPIVNDDDKLVGIITTMDLINHAYRQTV